MNVWLVVFTTFLASAVEAVEALTIVLAVGVTHGWKTSLSGAGVAVLALAGTILVGAIVGAVLPIALVRIVIGAFLVVFGLQWLRKAILRYAGHKAMRNEALAYEREVASLRGEPRTNEGRRVAYITAFNGVFLEGMEVALIVITVGASATGALAPAIAGATIAVVVVAFAGYLLRKPFERVPENTMKFVVGIMLVSFGTFWLGEGLGVQWWHDDAAILLIAGACACLCALIVFSLRFGAEVRARRS
jgi:uncharacterized membrane protein